MIIDYDIYQFEINLATNRLQILSDQLSVDLVNGTTIGGMSKGRFA